MPQNQSGGNLTIPVWIIGFATTISGAFIGSRINDSVAAARLEEQMINLQKEVIEIKQDIKDVQNDIKVYHTSRSSSNKSKYPTRQMQDFVIEQYAILPIKMLITADGIYEETL